ncbi:MAG TPA: alpha/beta fold hydrolase [Anaerolineae bacterium]
MATLAPRMVSTGRHSSLALVLNRNRLAFLKPVAFVVAAVLVVGIPAALLALICTAVASSNPYFMFSLAVIPVIGIGAVTLAYFAARPVLHPKLTHPQYTPADLDITKWQEVSFCSGDGLRLDGWFIPPDPRKDGATLIFVHGLGGNRGELLSEAVTLAFYGYGALLFDLRNHGTSQGNITTLGFSEVEDVCGAVRFLLTRPEVNSERIGVVGHSMGAVAAIRAAAQIPEIRAVVAESAYSSLRENIAQGLVAKTGLPPFLFERIVVWLGERATGIKVDQVSAIEDVPKISPRAVLFIHGKRDQVVNFDNSRQLYKAASEPKSLVLFENSGHSELLRSDPVVYNSHVSRFLDRYLRGVN